MSIQYGFALNANTAAVTDAQGRVTSAVPGVAGTVLTANLNAEPTFQPISLPANSTLVTPIISGATTKFTGLSGPETNPTATLVLDAGGNVKYSNKSGTGSVVMTNTATLTTPVIDGATSKFTSLSVNTAPTALVSLDGSGNINYTARTGTGTVVMSIAPNISQAELSGLAANSAPTVVLTQQGSDVVGFTTLTGSGPIVAQTSPSLTSPVVTGLKSSDLSTNSLVATDATAPRNLTSLAPGTSGQVLTSNGSGALPSYSTIIPGIISNVRQFEFLPTGLIQFYVPSVGCTKFYVELQGAGGSGGCPGNTNASTGGGGGGGAYCGFWMTNTNSITPNPGYTPPPAGHYLLNPGLPCRLGLAEGYSLKSLPA